MAYTGWGSSGDVLTSNGSGVQPSFQPASAGTYYSLTPYICGPTGDVNAQYTGDTAIADAIAQIITDAPTWANIYIKPGTYTDDFTIPSTPRINLLGESSPEVGGSVRNEQVISTVVISGSITCTGAILFNNIDFQGSIITLANSSGSQFVGCHFDLSSTITNSANAIGVFSNCFIESSITSFATKNLRILAENCSIESGISCVGVVDELRFSKCNFGDNSSIFNQVTSSLIIEVYDCYSSGNPWLDETVANFGSDLTINGFIFNGGTAIYAKPTVAWIKLSNITCYGSYFIDDTSGSGGNVFLFNSCDIRGAVGFVLSDNDQVSMYNCYLQTSNGVVVGDNTSIKLYSSNNINDVAGTFGTNSYLINVSQTTPPDSNTSTSGFGSISLASAAQNTLGYDILVNMTVVVTAATGATIILGVGPTNTPSTDEIVPAFTIVTVGNTYCLSAIVPANYYILLDTTGTITVGSVTTQVCPI